MSKLRTLWNTVVAKIEQFSPVCLPQLYVLEIRDAEDVGVH